MERLFKIIIFSCIIILASNCSSWGDSNTCNKSISSRQITLTPYDKAKQGQTVFIKIKSPEKLESPVFSFQGKDYKIFNTGKNEYTALLGINILQKPGKYKIKLHDKTGNLNDKAYIEIIPEKYPEQNIILSKKMQGLKITNYEVSRIRKAKYTLTNKKNWFNPPYNSPANGCINSVFGLKRLYNGKFSGNYHKGVDIKAPEGEPVRTITKGKVIIAENLNFHGGSVAVDHGNGLVSLYIHLSKIDVKPGDYVETDQKIGEVGMTGFATGPHLHWGLYVNGTPVDPMIDWIKPVNICQ